MADSFQRMRESALNAAKKEISSRYSKEEHALMQAISAYNETTKSYNLLYERLAEWYGIYYPELKVGSQELLAELALVLNKRGSATKEQIKSIVKDDRRSAELFDKASTSMGREMNDSERDTLVRFAKLSMEMKGTLDGLHDYIKRASNEIMPNITYLTDEMIAAEMLSKAGSLERLATMPASTIQLLGAEKALFKHLKFGSRPPKYGILFKMPEIGNAKRELRGRIARVYATKISIASRADAFSKRFIAKELKEQLLRSIKSTKAKRAAR